MTRAVLRTLVIEFLRDKGALVMAFVLPVAFFLVFAWIFAGTSGSDLRVRLAVADTVGDDDTKTLVAALRADEVVEIVSDAPDPAAARELVRKGKADAGLLITRSPRKPEGKQWLRLLYDPARDVASQMLAGRVQRALWTALPDLSLGNVLEMLDPILQLDDEQKARVDAGLPYLRKVGLSQRQAFLSPIEGREAVAGQPQSTNSIAYYAGAVAILFVLFSAVHGAISLLADRDAGIIDRVLAGPAGMGVLVNARFQFLTAMGFVQVGIIYLVAWLGYGVDLPGHILGWAATTFAIALCAAGLAIALVAACGSQRQAQTIANVAILIVSAIGGSMVPRFFMPPLLQDLGWLTPNTWGLEAYTGVFWRGDTAAELVLPIALLAAMGLAGLAVARLLARRWEVL